ncbi:MAG: hypothetical protein ACXVB4_16400 [Pseudobdellovibrionaceae bacterium]
MWLGFALPLVCVLFAHCWAGAELIPNNKDSSEDSIAIISIDAAGKSISKSISAKIFKQNLMASVRSVKSAIQPKLSLMDKKSIHNNAWSLRTVGVGIGMSGQFGLGPLIHITLSPKIRLVFTNSLHPIYPD